MTGLETRCCLGVEEAGVAEAEHQRYVLFGESYASVVAKECGFVVLNSEAVAKGEVELRLGLGGFVLLKKNRSTAEILDGLGTDIIDTSLAETGDECVQLLIAECKADCRGRVEVAQDYE